MDIEKLIERLNCPQIHSCPMNGDYPSCTACQKGVKQDATFALSTLQAENERLKNKLSELTRLPFDEPGIGERTRLMAENAQLRAELAQADREGRCGIPPVKMHQKIFRVFDGEIREEIVCGAIWEPLMPRPRWKVFVMGGGLPYFWHEVIGKTVFLTREEAEAALEGMKNG